MQENKYNDTIDLNQIVKKVWKRKSLFYIAWPITFVLACALILCVPRYYKSTVKLAPELGNNSSMGALGSIASDFGFDIGALESDDAISPLLYPELVASPNFLVSLFDIHVKNEDGTIDTDYYTYLRYHQKKTLYMQPFYWLKRQINKILKKKKVTGRNNDDGKIDPTRLSEDDDRVVKGLQKNIICNVDKKTIVISITVTDQDRIICADIADSVRVRLQHFITDYRTSKARIDAEHYRILTEDAYKAYKLSIARYSDFCDSHMNSILQSYLSKRDELENDMQLKMNTYTALNTQWETAKSRIQEKTPAFTLLEVASAPVKPAGPKRMLFVLGMLILTTFGTIIYILKEDLLKPFKS